MQHTPIIPFRTCPCDKVSGRAKSSWFFFLERFASNNESFGGEHLVSFSLVHDFFGLLFFELELLGFFIKSGLDMLVFILGVFEGVAVV